MVFVMMAFTLLGVDKCKDQKVEKVESAGELTVEVLERETETTDPKNYKLKGGIIFAVYAYQNEGVSTTVSKTLSFTKQIQVPFRAKVGEMLLTLQSLEIRDDKDQLIREVTSQEIEDMRSQPRFTFKITVLITKSTHEKDTGFEKKEREKGTVDPSSGEFISITTKFEDPTEILTTNDVEGALLALREIASATPEYHEELLALVKNTKTLDTAHLNLLLDACYFTFKDYEKLVELYQKMMWGEERDQYTDEDRETAQKNVNSANELSGFTNALLNEGISKVSDLTEELAYALLEKAYPNAYFNGSDISKAFDFVAETYPPIAKEAFDKFFKLAIEKDADSSARRVAGVWFKEYSDKSLETFFELASKFSYQSKDSFLKETYTVFESWSMENLILLIQASYEAKNYFANALVNQVSDFSYEKARNVVNLFSWQAKGQVLNTVLSNEKPISTNELTALISLGGDEAKTKLAIQNCARVTDPTVNGVVGLAQLVRWQSKDKILLECTSQFESMTSQELVSVLQNAHEQGLQLAGNHVLNLKDFGPKAVSLLAQQLKWQQKDKIILFSLDKFEKIQSQDVVLLVENAHEQKGEIAFKLGEKISDLTSQNAILISEALSWQAKDKFLLKVVSFILDPSPESCIKVGAAGYNQDFEIFTGLFDRVPSLTVTQAITVVNSFSYQNKDTFLLAAMHKVSDFSGSNILSYAKEGYDKDFEILMKLVDRVRDLTVANAISIASALSYQSKDAFLLRAVDVVTDLSTSNLLDLAKQSYNKKDEILEKGLKRLGEK